MTRPEPKETGSQGDSDSGDPLPESPPPVTPAYSTPPPEGIPDADG